jgi:hypothetical protein
MIATDYALQPIYAQLLSDESPDPDATELDLDEEEDEDEDADGAEESVDETEK